MARIRAPGGRLCGAAVVLGRDYALTCAHVLTPDPEEPVPYPEVTLESPSANWSPVAASVAPDGWSPPGRDGEGDLALLRLKYALPDCSSALLRTTWVGDLKLFGFPPGIEAGFWVAAEAAGRGGPNGEWIQLNLRPPFPPALNGYSGTGVFHEASGLVVGIVVTAFAPVRTDLAWMIPVSTILKYLPQVRPWVVDGHSDEDIAQFLVRQEHGGVMAVVTRDPLRERLPRETAPQAMARVDATNRGSDEVAGRLAGRMGIRLDGQEPPTRAVLARAASTSLIIDAADLAADPKDLLRRLLVPLARGAVGHDIRLLVGFREPLDSIRPRLVLLSVRVSSAVDIEQRSVPLRKEIAIKSSGPPAAIAGVGLRLQALTTAAVSDCLLPGVMKLEQVVDQAVHQVLQRRRLLKTGIGKRNELRGLLAAYWSKAGSNSVTEHPKVATAYRQAYDELWEGVCDLERAVELVNDFVAVVRRECGK